MRFTAVTIRAEQFPTSPLALRTRSPEVQARIRAFADQQAAAAAASLDVLDDAFARTGRDRHARAVALGDLHATLTGWRYGLAVRANARNGAGIAFDPERFRTPMTSRNYDRIGAVGRLREGAVFNPATGTFVGGHSTEAYEAMATYGALAERRFAAEAAREDELQNWIELPDRRRLRGNMIVRGGAAAKLALELRDRIAARGADASEVETGGEPMYTVTPTPEDSTEIFNTALNLLAEPGCPPEQFLLARYLLFQAPQHKKGSDAVTRTFTVTVGAMLYGAAAPGLHADEDLRAYVLGQRACQA